MFNVEVFLMKRILIHTVMVFATCTALQVSSLKAADSKTFVRLQSAGERWGSSRVWSRFNADQRTFRYKGVSNRSCFNNRKSGSRIFPSPQANRGSSLRSNLPSKQLTTRRSWGNTTRYSSRQRIISYRRYRSTGQANRGSTIGSRR
jgi:hypothetical protein